MTKITTRQLLKATSKPEVKNVFAEIYENSLTHKRDKRRTRISNDECLKRIQTVLPTAKNFTHNPLGCLVDCKDGEVFVGIRKAGDDTVVFCQRI